MITTPNFSSQDKGAATQIVTKDKLPVILPGFNLFDGLQRFQRNLKLYLKLILKFVDDYSDIGAEILQAIKIGDMHQADSLVHVIKGQQHIFAHIFW
jgi:hypothetical protein